MMTKMKATHNFLLPIEAKKSGAVSTGRPELDINLPPSPDRTSSGGGSAMVERGVSGCSYGVACVKSEWPTSHWTSGGGGGDVARGGSNSSHSGNHAIIKEKNQQYMWFGSSHAASCSNGCFGTPTSTRNQVNVVQKRHGSSMGANSKTSGVDVLCDEKEEEEFGKRYGSSFTDSTVRVVDARSNGDPKATTPRSKHCATEQRRRNKINDRFMILRDLLPQVNQKRDKASFLMEVIEYIQFLHERVQKYESKCQGWNHGIEDNSSWKNSQLLAEAVTDPSHCLKKSSTPPGFIFSASNSVPSIPAMVATNQTQEGPENLMPRLTSKSTKLPGPPYSANMVYHHSQAHRLRSESVTCGDVIRDQEVRTQEGMIRTSSAYSQGIVDSLTVALQNSGVDMSQADVFVQINLRGAKRSKPKTTKEDPSYGNHANGRSRVVSSRDDASQEENKRRKTVKSS